MRKVARFIVTAAALCGFLLCTPTVGGAAPESASAPSNPPATGVAAPAKPVAPSGAEPAAEATDQVIADYILGSGDNLRIIVFGEESLTGQFTVSGNGMISFPLIGDVPAAGKTVQEVRAEIATALADGYIRDPKVSAEVMTFRPYYILGEVEKPGGYPYINGLTVMNAIASAGGFTYRANNHDVFIKRASQTTEHKVRLNDSLQLFPGDTLRVGERYF